MLGDLSSAERCSKAKGQLVQATYINELNISLLPYNKHLINRS